MRDEMHVHIVPMTGDHVDEVAELERICFTTPLVPEHAGGGAGERLRRPSWWPWTTRAAWRATPGLLVVLDEGLYHQRGRAAGVPPAGSGEKASPGVPGLCPGPPPGVFDAGGPGVQLRGPSPCTAAGASRSAGRRKNYYEHPKEDAIIMTKEFADGTADTDTGAAADGL